MICVRPFSPQPLGQRHSFFIAITTLFHSLWSTSLVICNTVLKYGIKSFSNVFYLFIILLAIFFAYCRYHRLLSFFSHFIKSIVNLFHRIINLLNCNHSDICHIVQHTALTHLRVIDLCECSWHCPDSWFCSSLTQHSHSLPFEHILIPFHEDQSLILL